MMDAAINRNEIESPKVLAYVTDVYKFLTIVIPCYVFGIYLAKACQLVDDISGHWFLICSLVSLILSLDGSYGILFGSIAAVSYGIFWSDYFPVDQYTIFIIGCCIFIILSSVVICSKMLPIKDLIIRSSLVLNLFLQSILLIVTGMYSRFYVVGSLLIMTYYVYYTMHIVFNWAKHRGDPETSMKRDTIIVMDAYSVIFLGLFMRNN